MAAPNNIVLRPEFAQFQFPFIALSDLATLNDILNASNQTLLPTTSGLLQIPQVDPAKFAHLSLNAGFFFEVPQTGTVTNTSVINARAKRVTVNYTIDGIVNVSNVTEKIIIEKGSVRNINLTSMVANLVPDIVNLITTPAFVVDTSGTDGAAKAYVSPVVTLWY